MYLHELRIGSQSLKSFLYIKWKEFLSEWIDNSFSNKCLLNIANYFISNSVSAIRVYFSNLALSNRVAKIIHSYFVWSKFQNESYIFWKNKKFEELTNLSIVCQDKVSENQVLRSRVAETQQPDAERLKWKNVEFDTLYQNFFKCFKFFYFNIFRTSALE